MSSSKECFLPLRILQDFAFLQKMLGSYQHWIDYDLVVFPADKN